VFFFGSDLIADKIFSKPHLSFYFGLAAVFVVFKSLKLLNTQAVRGLRLIKVFAFMQFLPQGANLILLIVLGLFFYNKDIPVYAFLASFFVTGTTGWVIMEYSFKCKMRSDDQVMDMSARTILTISMPMLMTAMMTFAIGQTGVIMLGIFRSEAEVGYYAIAVKLATLTSLLLSAINSMAAPKFSELYHSNKIDELFYIAKKSAKLIFFTSSPILLVLLIFGKSILGILFGHNFSVAYFALALITIGQFVNSISGSTGFFMNMTGNQNALRTIMIFAASINVGLNLYLIPSIGINGAAVAGMVSICFWNIAALLYIKKKFGKTIAYLPFAR
jgi:O-antigen/teichoic acid export membrane protein